MPTKPKFTRIMKVQDLAYAGVPTEVIPTYCALADHANNRNGLAWPSLQRISCIIGRSTRTVSRHIHKLQECGVVEIVERRRHRGRFSSYLFRIVHIVRTSGHQWPPEKLRPNRRGSKRTANAPPTPPAEALNWFLGKERDLRAEAEHERLMEEKRKKEAERRRDGYSWFFNE